MSFYIDVCGEKYMCYDWFNLIYYILYLVFLWCFLCFCDDFCFWNLSCCLDKFFERLLVVLVFFSVYLVDSFVRLNFLYIYLKSVDYFFIKYEIIEICLEFLNLEDK